jgi:hypothetical protein
MTWSKKRIGWLSLVAALLIAGGLWLAREIRIDKCLDAGGAWDYQAGVCKMAEGK